jgi:hypothetical protein
MAIYSKQGTDLNPVPVAGSGSKNYFSIKQFSNLCWEILCLHPDIDVEVYLFPFVK